MTAVSLFDLMALQQRRAPGASPTSRLATLANEMMQACLVELERLRRMEQEFLSSDVLMHTAEISDEEKVAFAKALYDPYQQWASDAAEVLDRAREMAAGGAHLPDLERLKEAYGQVSARLEVTPEQIGNALRQVRQGQAVPLKELRDELRTRLRP